MAVAPRFRTESTDSDTSGYIPITLRWGYGGKEVFVAGTFTNWELLQMIEVDNLDPIESDSEDDTNDAKKASPKLKIPKKKAPKTPRRKKRLEELEFFAIIDVPEGRHEFKFKVNGEWIYDPNLPTVRNDLGTHNNVIIVKKSDYEIINYSSLSSLGCLSINIDVPLPPPEPSKPFSQEIPKFIPELPSSAKEREQILPSVPPLLLDSVASAAVDRESELSCMLPVPSHPTLNHFYCRSIRQNTFSFATTCRYRNKYVTVIFYRKVGLKMK